MREEERGGENSGQKSWMCVEPAGPATIVHPSPLPPPPSSLLPLSNLKWGNSSRYHAKLLGPPEPWTHSA
jgi:hypothetical protein